jgi:ACS family D-galactonate transporter-like MFS transporter
MSQSANETAPGTATVPADAVAARWNVVLLLMALCFISHLSRLSMSAAGDARIMDDFGLKPEEMGKIYSAFLLVYSICMIPGGWFIDRFGPRVALRVMGFGSAFFAAMTGMVGLVFSVASQVWFSLMIVRSLMGLVSTPLHPGSARAIADWIPLAQRSWANGLVTGAAIVGVASTHVGFRALMGWFGWQGAFLVIGLCTALWALVWSFYVSEQPARDRRQPSIEVQDKSSPAGWAEWRALLRNRSLILLTLSYAAVGYFQYLFFYWMHYYFEKVLKLGASASAFYAAIPPLAMAVTMPLGGWLSDRLQRVLGFRLGRTLVPAIGMLLSALLLGLGVLAKEPGWIVGWFTLALGAMGASEGSFWSSAVEAGGAQGGTGAAICNTGGNAGGMLAPWLTPLISAHFGWPWGISLGGVICFLGAILWFWIDPAQRVRHHPATNPDL